LPPKSRGTHLSKPTECTRTGFEPLDRQKSESLDAVRVQVVGHAISVQVMILIGYVAEVMRPIIRL
jgi:hypothetical protein